ncbi:hypothetical protein [Alteromonas abrolhosensis]|uniref:hypothetical protein n=1 Tax=Alteromonas abrolhosensis TaxID=1892904 RepID=UPI00096BC938|nr:hypothetical protein [Alteromonas abrolhosensis]
MSSSQFVIEHIYSVLGGAGFIITGLSAYLGKLLADKSLLREKAGLEKIIKNTQNEHQTSIKLLEKELQLELVKKDQFHQISKSTFENIFNKKIDIYSELLIIKAEYEKFKHEDGSFEFIDPTYEFISHFKKFRKSIEENRLYISNELSDKYDDWYLDAATYFRKIEEIEFNIQAHAGGEDSNKVNRMVWEEQEPVNQDLVNNTIEKMASIIKQIEIDVRKIRESVNFVEVTA